MRLLTFNENVKINATINYTNFNYIVEKSKIDKGYFYAIICIKISKYKQIFYIVCSGIEKIIKINSPRYFFRPKRYNESITKSVLLINKKTMQ